MDDYTFILNVFKYVQPGEFPLMVDASQGWKAHIPRPHSPWCPGPRPARPLYFSVAAHKPAQDGPSGIRRSKQTFSSAHVVVLDDIGTKVDGESVPLDPDYILETSPGNFQWGYLIDRTEDQIAYEELLGTLAIRGYTDPGSTDSVHLFRVPGSLHKTGFVSVLRRFRVSPRRRKLATLARKFGAHITEGLPAPIRKSGRPVSEEKIAQDTIYAWLIATNRETTRTWAKTTGRSSEWVTLTCPWAEEHTSEEESHAYYKPGTGIFKCFHASCCARTTDDFLTWVGKVSFEEGTREYLA